MTATRTFPEPDCLHFSASVDTNHFIARMRFHQSWYRHTVLGLEPGPNPRGQIYGNMLTQQDGHEGRIFLSESTFEHAKERYPFSKGGGDASRVYCNLLSSEPMCFNLFGPLKSDLDLATDLMRRLAGFPGDASVVNVLFEDAPDKESHLNDGTSFDVFVEYKRPGERRGLVGIEIKLTEPFTQKHCDFDADYARWQDRGEWWWKPGAEADFSNLSFNQLWRNHLLVYAMLNQPEPEYDEGSCAVVHAASNAHTHKAIASYRALLYPVGDQTLHDWTLQSIVEAWTLALDGTWHQKWLDGFRNRYLDLEASESSWQTFKRGEQ